METERAMSDTQTGKPSIGDEIPYRRDQIDKKTGSLVFDQHLKETLNEAPTPSIDDAMPKDDNPLKRGQVT
jgi:hypothetical protein